MAVYIYPSGKDISTVLPTIKPSNRVIFSAAIDSLSGIEVFREFSPIRCGKNTNEMVSVLVDGTVDSNNGILSILAVAAVAKVLFVTVVPLTE